MTTPPGRVVHCRREPHDVYVGRPGPFGNPFLIGVDGDRDQVVARYEGHARERLAADADFREAVAGLHGKVLGCWCAPRACHGDVLARLAAELAE